MVDTHSVGNHLVLAPGTRKPCDYLFVTYQNRTAAFREADEDEPESIFVRSLSAVGKPCEYKTE